MSYPKKMMQDGNSMHTSLKLSFKCKTVT